MEKPICVVAGVGPANGLAISRQFADAGYRLVLLARGADALQNFQREIADSVSFPCDLSDQADITRVFGAIKDQLGAPQTLIYNAGSGLFSPPMDTSPEDFERAWRLNALGLLLAAQQVAPGMIAAGGGEIIVIGATASLRGGANFTAFAAAKAAQRSVAQSLARSLGPQGIHVGLVVIDGIIDTPRARQRDVNLDVNKVLKPQAIAQSVYHLCQQDGSAWSFEIDLRPGSEKW
jgi:NAD(P)-dependent dehydrogenase (short-subunit alcohol dehydrogenase family)